MTELPLTTSEARDVLAAVVARVAQDAQLDVLLIKGASLAFHGLRAERAWGDVDVLVRPNHVHLLRRELTAYGWEVANETVPYPLITHPHALTLIHPRWHTEIDLHTFLPGSYADAAITFDQLWAERTAIQLAHQPVICTGRIGSGLVAALNLARTRASQRTRDELPQWLAAVRSWSESERLALATLAAECGSADVLAELFDAAGVPATGRGFITRQERKDWDDRIGQEARRGYAWGRAIWRAPGGQKLRLAFRALTYDRGAADRGDPQPTGWARVRHVPRRSRLAASLMLRRKPWR